MGGGNSKTPYFIEKKVNEEEITKEVKLKGPYLLKINESPVVMYTKASCGYCKMAKDLLGKENIHYREHDLDAMKQERGLEEAQRYLNGLIYVSRYRLVPQVFICGKFIGGYTELAKLHEAELLKDEISRCTDDRFD